MFTSNDGNVVNELGLEETVTSNLELLRISLSTSLLLQTMVRIYQTGYRALRTWPPTQQLSGVCLAVNMSGLVLAQSVLFCEGNGYRSV